jgi:hypothetical protein
MKYNFTDNQKELLRWIYQKVTKGELQETFYLLWEKSKNWIIRKNAAEILEPPFPLKLGVLQLFHEQHMLVVVSQGKAKKSCTVTGDFLRAIRSNFAEEESHLPVSTLAQPYPPEIAMSLDRLRAKYPDPKKMGFLVMRFTAAKPFARIVKIIKETAAKHDIIIVRADENEFHADLWGNVRTHLHGCGFGIAVYERIETNEPNANVGLEVGYLMAMSKPVLLLKDKTLQTLQADLAGKLYKQFDPHDPESTLPDQLNKWLEDNGIVVPKK